MEIQHVDVKIFVEGDLAVDPARFIELFHAWIKEGSEDELLIDVADYRHVPDGRGVLLVAHEADYAMDHNAGRWGLRYNRKAPVDGTNADRIGQALRAAASACSRLEDSLAGEGPLKFSRQEFELSINDRALAPNTPETFAALKPELEAAFSDIFGPGDFTLTHQSDPRQLFRVNVKAAQPVDFGLLVGSGS